MWMKGHYHEVVQAGRLVPYDATALIAPNAGTHCTKCVKLLGTTFISKGISQP